MFLICLVDFLWELWFPPTVQDKHVECGVATVAVGCICIVLFTIDIVIKSIYRVKDLQTPTPKPP